MAEYVNIAEFSLRCSVHSRKVKLAIDAQSIEVFDRCMGGGPKSGYRICWDSEWKKFMKWCSEARISSKKIWTAGVIDPERVNAYVPQGREGSRLDAAARRKANADGEDEETDEAEEGFSYTPVNIDEDTSIEDMLKQLGHNVSSIEADRVRKIIRARRELLEYQKSERILVNIPEFLPQFLDAAVILRKSMKAIPPRVCTQYAASTDHFKIKKSLEKELDQVLESFDLFLKRLQRNA